MAKSDRLLTVRFPLKTLAEFAAAAELMRARNVSELISTYVRETIGTVKASTPAVQWNKMVEEKTISILRRSEAKTKPRADNQTASPSQPNLDSGPPKRQNRERLIYADALTSPQPAKNKKRKGATGTDG